jgi:AcrR family transcriptional regulator
MSDPSRTTGYHHGDLHEALLVAGQDVLRERGLQGFTLRECARRAGVSHAAPKHHFGNARGFLTEIAARGFNQLVTTLRSHLEDANDDLDAQFLATSTAYAEFAASYPEHFRIMFRSDLLDTDSKTLTSAARATFTILTNVIRRQRGEPDIAAEALMDNIKSEALLNDILLGWCHVHGYAHLRMEGQLAMIPAGVQSEMLARAAHRLGNMIRSDAKDATDAAGG